MFVYFFVAHLLYSSFDFHNAVSRFTLDYRLYYLCCFFRLTLIFFCLFHWLHSPQSSSPFCKVFLWYWPICNCIQWESLLYLLVVKQKNSPSLRAITRSVHASAIVLEHFSDVVPLFFNRLRQICIAGCSSSLLKVAFCVEKKR